MSKSAGGMQKEAKVCAGERWNVGSACGLWLSNRTQTRLLPRPDRWQEEVLCVRLGGPLRPWLPKDNFNYRSDYKRIVDWIPEQAGSGKGYRGCGQEIFEWRGRWIRCGQNCMPCQTWLFLASSRCSAINWPQTNRNWEGKENPIPRKRSCNWWRKIWKPLWKCLLGLLGVLLQQKKMRRLLTLPRQSRLCLWPQSSWSCKWGIATRARINKVQGRGRCMRCLTRMWLWFIFHLLDPTKKLTMKFKEDNTIDNWKAIKAKLPSLVDPKVLDVLIPSNNEICILECQEASCATSCEGTSNCTSEIPAMAMARSEKKKKLSHSEVLLPPAAWQHLQPVSSDMWSTQTHKRLCRLLPVLVDPGHPPRPGDMPNYEARISPMARGTIQPEIARRLLRTATTMVSDTDRSMWHVLGKMRISVSRYCPNIRLRLSATYSCCQRCQRVPPNGPPNFCLRLCKISNGTCTVSVVLKSHSLQVGKKGHSWAFCRWVLY